ncbi:MAG: hypothetical protein QM783_03520 [Phycisphaerales bacterium]
MLYRAGCLALLCVAMLLGGCLVPYRYDFEAWERTDDCVVVEKEGRRELRAIVSTGCTWKNGPPISCSSHGSGDHKSWLVVVSLGGAEPLEKRATVVGPLSAFDPAGDEDAYDYGDGAWGSLFRDTTQRPQVHQPQAIFLDHDGNVVRLRRVAATPEIHAVRERLEWDDRAAKFVTEQSLSPVKLTQRGGAWANSIECLTAPLMARKEIDGVCRAYSSEDGSLVNDEWLTASLAALLGARSRDGERLSFPDPDHLLLLAPEGEAGSIRVCVRPSSEWRSFDCPTPVIGAFNVDGKLVVLTFAEGRLCLGEPTSHGLAMNELYAKRVDGKEFQVRRSRARVRLNDRAGEVASFADVTTPSGGDEEMLMVSSWRYREGTAGAEIVPVMKLFHGWFNSYVPNRAVPVENP